MKTTDDVLNENLNAAKSRASELANFLSAEVQSNQNKMRARQYHYMARQIDLMLLAHEELRKNTPPNNQEVTL